MTAVHFEYIIILAEEFSNDSCWKFEIIGSVLENVILKKLSSK